MKDVNKYAQCLLLAAGGFLLMITLLVALAAPVQGDKVTGGISGPCVVFPNSVFYARVDTLPLAANSKTMINFLSKTNGAYGVVDTLFRAGSEPGQPGSHKGFEFTYIDSQATPPVPSVTVVPEYVTDSDFGPAPIPTWAKIQGGNPSTPLPPGPTTPTYTPTYTTDRHVIVVDQRTCNLYELFRAYPQPDGNWEAGSTARWTLGSNAIRTPLGKTSADAAGLPMYPLIALYNEVNAGMISHALRVNVAAEKVRCTRDGLEGAAFGPLHPNSVCPQDGFPIGYTWPASHSDGTARMTTPGALPMGARLRLRGDYVLTCPTGCPQAQVFVTALKTYGVIIADTNNEVGDADMGLHAEWTADGGWNEDDIHHLRSINLYEFEVVKMDTACPQSYRWCPTCSHCP